ncbi:hypothetical protein OEZ85_002238 [Tetradesmus obliquus]|uniref:Uncharacterized protein n=1 Tax=Tetradesmus obliquus TaxID=3088 RepID=A0ABY8U2C6_TETOB|nr:hypothetical protein OEZ85_002238 [Tetradesmus obliquus]
MVSPDGAEQEQQCYGQVYALGTAAGIDFVFVRCYANPADVNPKDSRGKPPGFAPLAFALALLTLIPGTRSSKKGQSGERQAPPPPKKQKAAKAQPMQLPVDDLEDDYEQEEAPAAAAKGSKPGFDLQAEMAFQRSAIEKLVANANKPAQKDLKQKTCAAIQEMGAAMASTEEGRKLGAVIMMLAAACDNSGIPVDASVPLGALQGGYGGGEAEADCQQAVRQDTGEGS